MLLGLIKQEQIDQEIAETGIFKESIHQMIVKIDETLKFETKDENSNKSPELNACSHSMVIRIKAKLPKIVWKKLQGDPIQYNPFWDAFSHAVDENQLSDVDKFNYLKNLLEGPAATAINGLISLTADNYAAAKVIFDNLFGQKQNRY